jgi:hypothetical protein
MIGICVCGVYVYAFACAVCVCTHVLHVHASMRGGQNRCNTCFPGSEEYGIAFVRNETRGWNLMA